MSETVADQAFRLLQRKHQLEREAAVVREDQLKPITDEVQRIEKQLHALSCEDPGQQVMDV